jgi:RHS repeat-associated protein
LVAVGVLLLWLVAVVGFAVPVVQAQPSQTAVQSGLLGVGSSSMELLTGGDERRAAEEAVLADPEAVAARARSRTQYEGLKAPEAILLAERTFMIQRPGWRGPTAGEPGARVERYVGEDGAQEVLPSGERVLAQSTVPLRSAVGSGELEPLSLSLEEEGDSFKPANPLLPVLISKQAAGGISFPYGVSVAPVQAAATEGTRVVGDRVVFGGTAKDTSFMVEPVAGGGVEASWQLLSQESPQENSLRFNLPAGASLQMSSLVPGQAEVVAEGMKLLTIPAAVATEADGVTLPVSYAINGNVLSTHVDLSGSVAFPVMVDPLIDGSYGQSGAGSWSGWNYATNSGGYYASLETSEILSTWATWAPNEDYGGWYISAPGAGTEGGAAITKVWLYYMYHEITNQSWTEADFGSDQGSNPVYTNDGYNPADTKKAPLVRSEAFNEDMEFCAQGAGGYEGDPTGQPLCNENVGAETFAFFNLSGGSLSGMNSTSILGAIVVYADDVAPNEVSISGLSSKWVQYGPSSTSIYGHDQGTGIAAFKVEVPPGHLNESGQPYFAQEIGCTGAPGFTGCPQAATSSAVSFSGLATGAYTLGVYAYDAVGNVREESPDPHLYVDHTAPKIEPLTGSLVEDASKVGAGDYTLNFDAVDGSESAPQSGVRTVSVAVDGTKVDEITTSCPEPTAVPAANCFGLSGSWTMEGEHYGAGPHTITVTAKDWMGNETTETLHVTAAEASYATLGPGAVNLQTGNYKLAAADVQVASPGAALSLSRSYESRNQTAGSGGPLGPQWSLSLPDGAADGVWQSLHVEPNGNVEATLLSGARLSFVRSGSSFVSPVGYQTETLTASPVEKPSEYQLSNAVGDATIFKHAEHEEEGLYTPTGVVQATGAGGLNKITYSFEKTSEGITRPTKVLAPPPAGVSCSSELVKGCRELTFNYAETTTAKGEGFEEWGDYKGRLTRVYLHAWNREKGEMTTTTVAQYAYDAKGRLRAEWNPQVSPALKTTYGYDAEGHVTALTAPGQQTWAMTYGTVTGDTNAGRLIKVVQAPAGAGLWKGEVVANTEAPKLSGSPVVGAEMAVSQGKWSGGPVAYSYRWEDCNTKGEECAVIPGATNADYSPVSSDIGHELIAQVTATNGGGSIVVGSAASGVVSSLSWPSDTQTVDSGNGLNAVACIPSSKDCVLSDSKGNELYATNVTATGAASWSSWTGPGSSPSEALSCPTTGLCLLAAGSEEGKGGNLYYAKSLGGSWTQAFSPAYGVDAVSCVSSTFCVAGQDGDGYMHYSTSPASSSWTLLSQGTASMNSVYCISSSFCAVADSSGNVHVATSTSQIESSSWAETKVDSIALTGIACTSTTSCVAVDALGDVLNLTISGGGGATATKHDIDGFTGFTAVTCAAGTTCVAVDNRGNIFVSTNAGAEWAEQTLGIDLTSISCASSTLCVTADTRGDVTAFDPAESIIQKVEPESPQPGATVEYNVPVSGAGAPNEMGVSEVAKWAQKDDPVSATAIFPADKPQGWPASSYQRATVYYLDSQERTVNVANPAGGITTAEYNASNDNVERTLSVDNRAAALKEGSKSAEVAEHVATESKYNSEGTELTSTLGPEHKVKLPNGEEVQARKHTVYSYDEGAPEEGGPYYLVTKTTETAKLADGEEKDQRSIRTSYSGQEGLGWKLDAATSTTTDPASINQTRLNLYSKETGSITETRAPGGNAETVSPPEPSFTFGTSGSGQLKEPEAVAFGPEGDAWVIDQNNNRIVRFTSTGGFVASYGSAGKGSGQYKNAWGIAINQKTGNVYVADTENNRVQELNNEGVFVREWGEHGTGETQFDEPDAVTIDAAGHVWVANWEDDRVQEFSETGTFMRAFGAKGTANGDFEHPTGLVFSQGMLYVVDHGNKRVEQFSTSGSVEYTGQFGVAGKVTGQLEGPWGVGAAPVTGDLFVVDEANDKVVEYSPAGKELGQVGWLGTGSNEFEGPTGIAVNAAGSLYVADPGNNRISVWKQPEAGGTHMTYSTQFGTAGKGEGQFEYATVPATDSHGDVWVTDFTTDHLQEFSSQGKFLASYASEGTSNGHFIEMTGIAVNQATNDMYVGDCENHRVQELGPKGEFIRAMSSSHLSCPGDIALDSSGDVWVTDMAGDEIEEFSSTGSFLHAYGSKGSGNLQFNEPIGIAVVGSTVYVADTKNDRIQEISTSGAYVGQFSKEGPNGGQLNNPEGITANQAGDLMVLDSSNNRIEEFSPAGHYMETVGEYGHGNEQLAYPEGIAITPAGDLYIADAGNHRVQKWAPEDQAVHDSRIVYYTTAANSEHKECGEHAEWANLPCRTEPAAQPETEGLPALPITTYEYNLYDEPIVTKSTSGTATRTETDTYDAAGRPASKELTSTAGASMPKITYSYNSESGLREKQTAGEHTITSVYNTHGQLTNYTDGEEATSTYKYDIDGRTAEEDTPFGSQSFTYNETTGEKTKLVDSAAGTFTAAYDQEGDLTSETLPDGLTACYTRNATGEATGLEYRKAKSCSEGAVWFSNSTTPTTHEQWASQTSSFSSENYAYDEAGHLIETQETPAGKGCIARLYSIDEESNRTSLTTRQPGTEGKCATEGGAVERHTYDPANRLTDEGVEYNPFGDITSLPASDADGSTLESAYYADGQVTEQRQEGVTLGYQLDPARRSSEITTTSSKINSTLIDHYAGEGATPAWTSETDGKWTRYIYGINNGLAAIQTDAEKPTLQLSNLHGDIIGTAADEESATKLLSSTNTTEYGVPTIGSPSRYSWLGTQELPTEFPSGVAAMGARSYVPQIGRFLQPDPQPGGSANAYAYTHGNPLNETDLSGEWSLNQTSGGLSAVGTGEGQQLAGGTGIAAGAITPGPVNAQLEAAFWASPPWDQETAGNEEYEEYEKDEEYEEESEYGGEYVSNHSNPKGEETNIQSGLLIEPQPLGGDPEGQLLMVKGGPGIGCEVSKRCKRIKSEKKQKSRGEGQEWCEQAGGAIGGAIGGAAGDVPGGFIGGAVGAKIGGAICHE